MIASVLFFMLMQASQEAKDVKCLDYSIAVKDGKYHFKGKNTCNYKLPEIYIRLTFYDKDGYRHGFSYFSIEPLDPGEKARLESKAPREGGVNVRVMNINTDKQVFLSWIGRGSDN